MELEFRLAYFNPFMTAAVSYDIGLRHERIKRIIKSEVALFLSFRKKKETKYIYE